MPLFLDNISSFVTSVIEKGEFSAPLSPTTRYSPVAIKDIAEAYRAIIRNPAAHNLRTYSVHSDTFSYEELAKELGSRLRPTTYHHLEKQQAIDIYT